MGTQTENGKRGVALPPRKVFIWHDPHRVEVTSEGLSDGDQGMYKTGRIILARNLSWHILARSLVHEMAHGYWQNIYSPDATIDDEQFARLAETMLVDIVLGNGELIDWILEGLRASQSR